MKLFLLLFFVGLFFTSAQNTSQIEDMHKGFINAVNNKSICKTWIENLSDKQSSAINIAYLGAFETLWAKHAISPIKKLQTFKNGKTKIDEAKNIDPRSVEIRFIRWSIQKNAPAFLRYNQNIAEDEKYIRENYNSITSQFLKQQITKHLITS